MMIFYVNVKPFAERLQNKVEIASEILVLVIGYHMVTFAGFNMGNAYRETMGHSSIILTLILILMHVFRWVFHVTHRLQLRCRRWKNHRIYRIRKSRRESLRSKKLSIMASIETERGLISTERNMNTHRR